MIRYLPKIFRRGRKHTAYVPLYDRPWMVAVWGFVLGFLAGSLFMQIFGMR